MFSFGRLFLKSLTPEEKKLIHRFYEELDGPKIDFFLRFLREMSEEEKKDLISELFAVLHCLAKCGCCSRHQVENPCKLLLEDPVEAPDVGKQCPCHCRTIARTITILLTILLNRTPIIGVLSGSWVENGIYTAPEEFYPLLEQIADRDIPQE